VAAPCLLHGAATCQYGSYLGIAMSDIILPFGIMWSGMEYIFPPCIIITCPAVMGIAPSVIILAIAASVMVFLAIWLRERHGVFSKRPIRCLTLGKCQRRKARYQHGGGNCVLEHLHVETFLFDG